MYLHPYKYGVSYGSKEQVVVVDYSDISGASTVVSALSTCEIMP
jgi:hypothetical protein